MSRLSDGIKGLLPHRVFRPARAIATAIITPFRFSAATGHWKSSLAEMAVTRLGQPIPWYTYPAIDFLSARDFTGKTVLEFGGGQSTLFWAKRAAHVLTIEEDRDWHHRLQSQIPSNVELHHVPVEIKTRNVAPIKTILDARPSPKFDIIVIDGHLRPELTALAFDYLAPRGAMVLDNSEGYGFYDVVKSRNCRRIDFYGFTPGVARQHCTSLVYVDDCFLFEPTIPIVNVTGVARDSR